MLSELFSISKFWCSNGNRFVITKIWYKSFGTVTLPKPLLFKILSSFYILLKQTKDANLKKC